MTDPHSDRGLDRLVNFSDATVAIAITLLILPLVDAAEQFGQDTDLTTILRDHASAFLAFAISFTVIGRFWISHHRVFERVRDYNLTLIRANFLWLASIVFLPFAANALAADAGQHRSFVNGLYVGTMLATCLALVLVENTLQRHPTLLRPSDENAIDLTDGIVTAALMLAALIIAVAAPEIGMWALLLLVASTPVTRLVLSRRGRRTLT